jgi:nucleoside 2-deoxyribosyltransferase
MRAFITVRFMGKENKADVEQFCALIKDSGFEDFCFVRDVEKYEKVFDNSHDLMQRARDEIDMSDVVIIDITDAPSGGRALEAGIAFGLNKKVILIYQKGTPVKIPWEGIATALIEYENLNDIVPALRQYATA